jgi:hypothetical protein
VAKVSALRSLIQFVSGIGKLCFLDAYIVHSLKIAALGICYQNLLKYLKLGCRLWVNNYSGPYSVLTNFRCIGFSKAWDTLTLISHSVNYDEQSEWNSIFNPDTDLLEWYSYV